MRVRVSSLLAATIGALLATACSDGAELPANKAKNGTGSGSGSTSTGGGSCTDGAASCKDGALSACEGGVVKTAACPEQCAADGFQPNDECTNDGSRCWCGNTTDPACTDGINALCACLDGLPACQAGSAMLDTYTRCHRDPASETAALLKCFAGHMSGGQVACNTAIMKCGDTVPSTGCTADADCGHCERCERSTGKCLTRVACD